MIPILCYHKVGPIAEEGRFLNVEPERLRDHVLFFKRRNYSFVRAIDLVDPWPSRAVCLTFDDAYLSTMTHGVETLNSLQTTATFYAVPGYVGQSSNWDQRQARPLASWDVLSAAARDGHEIGNHSLAHPHLADLDYDGQSQQILDARTLLEEQGYLNTSLCYPFGSFNTKTLAVAKALGFKIAVTLQKGIASPDHNKLALPRITVACGDAIPLLLYKIFVRPKLPKSRKTVVQ
ncbi:MAG: polysaccharide deacetylase family protein [Fimbriimonadaceae bacterium]